MMEICLCANLKNQIRLCSCIRKYFHSFHYVAAASAEIALDVFGLLLNEILSGVVLLSSSMVGRGFPIFPFDCINTEEHNGEETGIWCGEGWVGNSLEIEMSEPFVWPCKLSALYISCKSRITDASPTVSLKNNISIVDVRIILSNGMARSSRPNLVG